MIINKKDYLLIAGGVILAILSYEVAIKKTIDAWTTHQRLANRIIYNSSSVYQPAYLERKLQNLDRIISRYSADTLFYRNNSVNTISEIAEQENVKVAAIPSQEDAYQSKNLLIEKIQIEGDYFSLIRFLWKLQNTSEIGFIRSEDWKLAKIESGRDSDGKLVVDIFLAVFKK